VNVDVRGAEDSLVKGAGCFYTWIWRAVLYSNYSYNIVYKLNKMNLYSRAIFENLTPSKTAAQSNASPRVFRYYIYIRYNDQKIRPSEDWWIANFTVAELKLSLGYPEAPTRFLSLRMIFSPIKEKRLAFDTVHIIEIRAF